MSWRIAQTSSHGVDLGGSDIGSRACPHRDATHGCIQRGSETLCVDLDYWGLAPSPWAHPEWLRFLKYVDRETVSDRDLHLIRSARDARSS